MSRNFAYCRVSTVEQTTANQMLAIRNAGYDIPDNRIISETVSGGLAALRRKEFKNLIDNKLESSDHLVVLKLDRLGRDNIDVQQTIQMLIDKGIQLSCLDLPVQDLTSAEGKLMLRMSCAFAEFEKDRIRERTKEGLARSNKKAGRPVATKTTESVQKFKVKGLTQNEVTSQSDVSLPTVKRHWNK